MDTSAMHHNSPNFDYQQYTGFPASSSSANSSNIPTPAQLAAQQAAPIPLPSSGNPVASALRSAFSPGSFTSLAKSFRMNGTSANMSFFNSFMGSYEDRMRNGSWKGKFITGDNMPGVFAGALESLDVLHNNHPGASGMSYESNGGSLKLAKREAEFFQNFACCGMQLTSLHDLIEHYEEVHVLIAPQDVDSMELDSEPVSSASGSTNSSSSTNNSPPLKVRQPIPAKAPLQLSDVLAPPPNSTFDNSNTGSSYGSEAGRKQTMQALAGRAAFMNAAASGTQAPLAASPGTPATIWEGDFSQPTAIEPVQLGGSGALPASNSTANITIAPKRLIPNNGSLSPTPTAGGGMDTSTTAGPSTTVNTSASQTGITHNGGGESSKHGQENKEPVKLYHCPTPGCQKVYKQQNGLKYHLKNGVCDFETRDAIESGMTEAEAQEKSRPFVCQVGDGCTKRYRQLNGLRYHYLHGPHGALGLALDSKNGNAPPASPAAKEAAKPAPPPPQPQDLQSQAAANGIAPGAWEQQQQQQAMTMAPPPVRDEVLFSVANDDDDVEMED